MNKNYKLLKTVVEEGRYKVLEDDGEQIIIRYQLNSIHLYPSSDDDHFVSILLSNFTEVSEDNYADVVMRCHKLNEQLKQVKLFLYFLMEFSFPEHKMIGGESHD